MKIALESGQLYCWQWSLNQRLTLTNLGKYTAENLNCIISISGDKAGALKAKVYAAEEDDRVYIDIPNLGIVITFPYSNYILSHMRYSSRKCHRQKKTKNSYKIIYIDTLTNI